MTITKFLSGCDTVQFEACGSLADNCVQASLELYAGIAGPSTTPADIFLTEVSAHDYAESGSSTDKPQGARSRSTSDFGDPPL